MKAGGGGRRRIWGVGRRRQWRGRRHLVSGLLGFEGIGVTSTQADTVHSARRQTPASLLYTSKGPPIPNVDSAMGSAEAGFAPLGSPAPLGIVVQQSGCLRQRMSVARPAVSEEAGSAVAPLPADAVSFASVLLFVGRLRTIGGSAALG